MSRTEEKHLCYRIEIINSVLALLHGKWLYFQPDVLKGWKVAPQINNKMTDMMYIMEII